MSVLSVRKKLYGIIQRHRKWLVILLLTWGVFFIFLFARIFELTPEGYYAGHEYVWGDWAIHTALVNTFAYKDPALWFAYHPIYAGGKLTYPFLTNLISGLLVRWFGFSLPAAYLYPSILFSLIVVFGMYSLFFLLLRSMSRAYLAVSLLMLSSGSGFLNFIREFFQNPSWNHLAYPVREYSRFNQYEWGTGNIIIGMLMPQRAFLLGVALAVIVLTALIYGLERRQSLASNVQHWLFFLAGVVAGILPIAHPHTFIAVIVFSGLICVVHWRSWRALLWFVVPAVVVSVLLFLIFIAGGIENPSFIKWYPGWTSHGSLWSWMKMWLILWGAMVPLAFLGTIGNDFRSLSRSAQAFILGAWILFIVPNLYLFQPIRWDNAKLWLWVYVGFCAIASHAIGRMWHSRVSKIAAVILVISLSATGVLELTRLQQIKKHRFLFANNEDIAVGEFIRGNTEPLARFLVNPGNHNTPVMVWGVRPILMGFPAWVWNYGFLYHQREADVRDMFSGRDGTSDLLRQYQVSYVLIGPSEWSELGANEAYFAERFPTIYHSSHFKIYDVRNISSGHRQ